MSLHNTLSNEEALLKLQAEGFARTVVSFYRYVIIEDASKMRDDLFAEWDELGVLGRVYVAREGINAQISVPTHNMEVFRAKLDSRHEFSGVPFKIGVEQADDAFLKLIVRLKKRIVADGLEDDEYDVTNVGVHLSAREWNEKMDKEDTIIVDMRNNYEGAIGRFDGAIVPDAYTFRDELPMARDIIKEKLAENPNADVLLYCTGGIRCEKASAFMKHNGIDKVYQLHGGIIDYKHQVEREGLVNKFKGKNFVFDGRTDERISDDVLTLCHQCDVACDDFTNCRNEMCNKLFVQCADCKGRFVNTCGEVCMTIALLPEEERSVMRKGKVVQKSVGEYISTVAVPRLIDAK
jgi:UPF0176 protein